MQTRPFFLVLTLMVSSVLTAATPRPNILILMADDCTYSDLPLYGGVNVKTPRLDALASQGLTFDQAYVSMSMCVPCRAALHTGLYPMRSGVAWNHVPARRGLKSSAHYLKALGYRVGLAGKDHLAPKVNYPFEMVPGVERNCVAETADYDSAPLSEFMNRDGTQPFALVAAFTSPHAPWTVGDPSHFDPARFQLPAHLADTQVTRTEFAKYLAEIEVMDEQVGRTLDALEATGQADNTIVLFTSEQGAQFPGCKWTNWNAGVHTGLIVRWPGTVKPAQRTQALVQYCDILPTLLEAVGGNAQSSDFDGSSFLPVLKGRQTRHRDYAYFMHNNVPEGPAYPIRGVTDGRYHYLRNLCPERIYIEKHIFGRAEHNAYVPSMFWTSADDQRSYNLLERYMRRPAEQLYDNQTDLHQMTDLARDPDYADIMARLSARLDQWMTEQKDPGAIIDSTAAHQAARQQKHFQMP